MQHFVFGLEGFELNEAVTRLIRDYFVGYVPGYTQVAMLMLILSSKKYHYIQAEY